MKYVVPVTVELSKGLNEFTDVAEESNIAKQLQTAAETAVGFWLRSAPRYTLDLSVGKVSVKYVGSGLAAPKAER